MVLFENLTFLSFKAVSNLAGKPFPLLKLYKYYLLLFMPSFDGFDQPLSAITFFKLL